MNVLDDDTLLFFSGHPDALGLYQALETWLYEAFPHVEKRVMKTQISFYNRHLFACVSFLRGSSGRQSCRRAG